MARQTGSIIQVCVGVDPGTIGLSAFKEASRLIYRRDPVDSRERDGRWDQVRMLHRRNRSEFPLGKAAKQHPLGVRLDLHVRFPGALLRRG
jgi:hypothetical protein